MGRKEKYCQIAYSIWRGNDEAVKNFFDSFNKIYNSLPAQCKPPEGMAKLHYVEGFKDDIVKYWEVFEDDR